MEDSAADASVHLTYRWTVSMHARHERPALASFHDGLAILWQSGAVTLLQIAEKDNNIYFLTELSSDQLFIYETHPPPVFLKPIRSMFGVEWRCGSRKIKHLG